MTDTPLEQLPAEMPPLSVGELADQIAPSEQEPTSVQRVAVVTAVEVTGSRRVKTDISGDTWLSRLQDAAVAIGDRVSILQQGAVMLVIGRLSGTDILTPVGAVLPFAGSAAPTNWLLCNGSAVSRTTYAALFAVCGTTYGAGDGSTTFNVPNLVNKMPVGAGGTYSRGSTGGAATVTLATTNLPSHLHSISVSGSSLSISTQVGHTHAQQGSTSSDSHSHSVGNQGSRSDLLASGGSSAATSGSGTTGTDSHSHTLSGSTGTGGSHAHDVTGTLSGNTGSTGSGTAHENMPPYLGLSYIIRAA